MQARIVGFFIPMLIIFAGILTWFVSLEMVEHETSGFVSEREQETLTLAASVGSAPSTAALAEQLTLYQRSERVQAAVLTAAGDVRAKSASLSESSLDREQKNLLTAGTAGRIWPFDVQDVAVVATVPDESGDRLITIASSSDLRATLRGRLARLYLGTITALLLMIAAVYPLTQRALRPIDKLSQASEAFAGGDLDARVDVGRGAPELQKLAHSYNEMAAKVGSSMDRERAFVADASHHLGNLLTPLRLRIEALKTGDTARPAEQALAEVDRIEAVVERLLQLARAEDRREVVPLATDVIAAVNGCVETWRPLAVERGTVLEWGPREDVHALAAPGAIDEIVDLFIDNALKYGENQPIQVEVLRGLTNVRIVVRDHGPGLTEAEREFALRRFWRSPAHQNLPGSGLGLAVADALAEACGGSIEFHSTPGGGLEANLVLRRAEEGEHANPSPIAIRRSDESDYQEPQPVAT